MILDNTSPAIKHLCTVDKRLGKVINMVGSISYIPHEDGFAFLVHEIIEQMLSIKAGKCIYDRLVNLCNGTITPEAISQLSKDEIKSVGMSNAKADYIQNLTNAVLNNDLILSDFDELSDECVTSRLVKLRGIGNWTAKMYLIFVLDRPDILPYEDGAFLQSYRWLYKTEDCTPSLILQKCKKWKPYSSVAARYLYRALDMGLTKTTFHLYK